MNEPAIRNWKTQPPAGGWGFTYTGPNGQKFQCSGITANRVIAQLTDILKMNAWYVSDAHTWATANDIWTARSPDRATKAVKLSELPKREEYTPARQGVKKNHWDIRPAKYGPQIWLWLNVFGMSFDKDLWDKTIAHVLHILSPHESPATGCIDCFREFQGHCQRRPPSAVTNEAQAAEWVFTVHNEVRQKLGQAPVTWKWAATTFAWKVGV
jgi:hypothetical protein